MSAIYRFAGLAAPYDTITRRALRRWSFAPGAIAPGTGVRLLHDHDEAQRLGRVALAVEGVSGLVVRGRTRWPVRAGLGLSVGIIPVVVERRAGVFHVVRAVLDEISIVGTPAYPECVITEVHKEESWRDTPVLS